MPDTVLKTVPEILSQLAVIRESECIGCTKCIQACPVDAIIGAAKQMHTVLKTECIGCGLCIPPCPVDCIDLLPLGIPSLEEQEKKHQYADMRFAKHNARINQNALVKTTVSPIQHEKLGAISSEEITAAISRVMHKRSQNR
jgi:RnfABCDGE-type electron transport complex B subunit